MVLLLDLHQICVHIFQNTEARAMPGVIWLGWRVVIFIRSDIDLRMNALNV